MRSHKISAVTARLLPSFMLWITVVAFSIPIYLMLSLSLKTPQEIAEDPFGFPLNPNWQNYVDAWEKSSGSAAPSLGLSMVNSLLITGITVILVVGLASTGAYFIGRSNSRYAQAIYLVFVVAITVPIQLVIIPVYSAMNELGLLGSVLSTAMFYAGFLTPFAIFLITGFVRALPTDFEEAARIDGANQLQTFIFVVIPLLNPIISTVALLTGIAVWNDFFGQLVFLLGSGNETLPLTVFSFSSQYASKYELLAAGLSIATIPLVLFYLALQRRFVEGFASGIKG